LYTNGRKVQKIHRHLETAIPSRYINHKRRI